MLLSDHVAPKGGNQSHSKTERLQNMEAFFFQYNIEMLRILTFLILSMFSATFLIFSSFFRNARLFPDLDI